MMYKHLHFIGKYSDLVSIYGFKKIIFGTWTYYTKADSRSESAIIIYEKKQDKLYNEIFIKQEKATFIDILYYFNLFDMINKKEIELS